MASAKDSLNMGSVISFVLPNTTQDPDMCNNGIYVTDTYTAEIGKEIKQGERLSFQIDNIYMKNGGITSDDVYGTPISIPDSDALGYQREYWIESGACTANFTLGSDFNPKDGHKLLIAAYCAYAYGWQGTTNIVNVSFLFYDVDSGSIITQPQNTQSQGIIYVEMAQAPPLKYVFCNNNSSAIETNTLQHFMQAIAWGWGTVGYARNIKTAGFVLATSLASNIPIFDTQAHAEAYLRDNTVLEGLLNGGSDIDPEEEYKTQFDTWTIISTTGHNTRDSQAGGLVNRNYRFKPYTKGISFLMIKPTADSPYNLRLMNYSGYDAYTAGRGVTEEDEFVPAAGVAELYLDRSLSWGSDDYYTQFGWKSNIPRFYTEEDCNDYFNGLLDISAAANYAELARQDNSIIQSEWEGADIDTETSLGTNGMQYGHGCRLYAMSNIELASLFTELFNPANINDILDGTKLFGSASDCVAGIMYLPITDIDEIGNAGALAKIKIGSWTAENAEGRRILNNGKLIDCGSFVMSPSYKDFRDYEPYTMLFVMLPMVGFKQLTLSKYMDVNNPKTVSVKYAIDVTTGATCAMIFANGLLMDVFEGTAGASRPFSAIDNNNYINQVIGAVTGASNSASGSIAGINDAVTGAAKGAKIGGAAGAAGVAGIAAAGVSVAASGIYQGYQIQQAVDNPPIMSRGNLSGNLSYYTVDKITFMIAKKRTIRAENELESIGYPSGHGATVGSFSGFLSCSAFKMADGFTGTEAERNEIIEILKGGIYID